MADKEEILTEQQQPTEQDLAFDGQTSAEQADTVNRAPVKGKRKHTKAEIALNTAMWVIIAVLLISAVLRLFVFNTVTVNGDSMLPTYEAKSCSVGCCCSVNISSLSATNLYRLMKFIAGNHYNPSAF